ncbi:WAT1-related protein [Nymphaea thermarum]|nr:WAT1-related protein [Nymphaea thermarum]
MQMGRGIRGRFKAAMPAMSMVLAQIVFAGLNILYKIAVDRGMSLRVLVTYRFIVGAAFLAPIALFLESTVWFLILTFLVQEEQGKAHPYRACGILLLWIVRGIVGTESVHNFHEDDLCIIRICNEQLATNIHLHLGHHLQNNELAGGEVFAKLNRMERLAIRKTAGQAKIVGTLIGLGGAMLLSFYRGANIQPWPVQTHLLHHLDRGGSKATGNRALGSLLAVGSTLCYSVWLILQTLQARLSEHYPHPYTSTALLCLMAAIQSACFAGICDKEAAAWKLRWDVKLLTVIYAGVMVSGLMLTLSSWCVQKRGPLFVAVFNPLMLIIVVVFSSLFLNETLQLGSVLGGVLIVIGLYVVLWGKGKEKQELPKLPSRRSVTQAATTTAASASICPESSSSLSSDGEKPGVSGEP